MIHYWARESSLQRLTKTFHESEKFHRYICKYLKNASAWFGRKKASVSEKWPIHTSLLQSICEWMTHMYSRGAYSQWGSHWRHTWYRNFNQVGINNAMIYVMALSAKVRRNERLWHILDIGNIFGPTFGFKFHNNLFQGIKLPKLLQSSWFLYSYTG